MEPVVRILYVMIFMLLCIPVWNYAQDSQQITHKSSLQVSLNQLSFEDQQALSRLFYVIMRNEHGAYTLFGDKAVSLSGEPMITPVENLLRGQRCGSIFWKCWQVWKAHATAFSHPHYLLFEDIYGSNENNNSVIFINKKQLIQVVNQHLTIFQKILGNDFTSEKFLHQIESEHRLTSLIQDNQLLWGILLGYGVHNSQLYARREQLDYFFSSRRLPKLPLKAPLPSHNFSSIEEEYEKINAQLQLFGEDIYPPYFFSTIHFAADREHPETKELEEKYHKLWKKISAIYAQGNFLEITLRQLTSK